MQMKITDIFSYGSDRLTSQTQWHIQATIEGQPVDIFYLDAGNNAEYDHAVAFSATAPTAKLHEAIQNWYESGADITRVEAGDVVSLSAEPQTPAAAPTVKRAQGPKR